MTGLVQGVGFRWFVQSTAQHLGLTGWVANDSDGGVSGEVEGPAAAMGAFFRAIGTGPARSRVDMVEAGEPASAAGATSFAIRR
ncbi:MAG: acylphosphatase [Gemmatimonadaceae bacterium]|nr:acylphosphatase [Gemmatimonadaceae bacterium]